MAALHPFHALRPTPERAAAVAAVPYDVLIVAALERPAGTLKRLGQLGVATERIVMLRPDWTATTIRQKALKV